ncbi:hypothetical protein [Pseudomonas syringae]|uniref:hypothetical protein n=1 Tax=Pseudomonas syringae TaxID=317 RepID=UPI000BB6044B|nr:hypothetical protein [Pseudomonas syringae]PBP77948.1 hypothetical protein CCL22_21405 [Pseudomonas syringae]
MTAADSAATEILRVQAIGKLRSELSKDIALTADVAASCGLWDLLRLCYLLRVTRMLSMPVPGTSEALSHAEQVALDLGTESLKYAIALLAKHGQWCDDTSADKPLDGFDNERVMTISQYTRHINTKFETEIILHFANVRLVGDRGQNCMIDFAAGLDDPRRTDYLHYGLRVESASGGNDGIVPIMDLMKKLHDDYSDVADLFATATGVTLEVYCEGMLELHSALVERLQEAEGRCGLHEDGGIDLTHAESFIAIANAMLFTDSELEAAFSPEFVAYLRSHTFDGTAFNDTELRFHYLSRRPFLFGEGFAIFSPELIFDSVLGNTHFTLLESPVAKAKYMEHRSAQFIDKVAMVAAGAGYEEFERELDLKEGRYDIGDIDLILRHPKTGHTLLVEGKGHPLPLPVYFRAPDAVEDHVKRTRDWEKKVQRRIDHLKGSSSSYPLSGAWDYIIVSLMPEPLSQHTHLLVLSIDEFEYWLAQNPRPTVFADLFSAFYDRAKTPLSMVELQALQESGFTLIGPNSPPE